MPIDTLMLVYTYMATLGLRHRARGTMEKTADFFHKKNG